MSGPDLRRIAERVLRLEADAILALVPKLDAGFARAVETLRGCAGRVIVTGMGKSGHVARKIASTLASTGTPAFFVHPGEASHGDLGMIANNDVILALSWSGETAELKNITDYSRRYGIKLIAMTAISDSALAKVADAVLALPQAREACPHNLAPTTSSLMQLALGDAVLTVLGGYHWDCRERHRRLQRQSEDWSGGLGPGTKEVFYERLAETHPELLPMYKRMYGARKYASKADRVRTTAMVNKMIGRQVTIRSRANHPSASRTLPTQLNLL